MERTNVAIVGMGTVGTGVAKLLLDHGDRTGRHAGRTLWLKRVVVNDVSKPRQADLPDGLLTDDLTTVTEDPEISVVAQLVGGLEPARTIMLKLLESGKDIVTANKALLAVHGPELFDRARELGQSIAFEASVAGGIPIITNIGQCLSANQITSLRGILNGTSNFIISQMEEHDADYGAAVAEAQRLGFAEADPTMDVDGSDAAQKLAILAHLAFGARVHWSDIPRVGIDKLDPADLGYARELGYRIKLLAIARLESCLELHVSPTLGPDRSPAGGSPRGLQRGQRGRRRCRTRLLPWAGCRADANGVGRGGRFDRHRRGTHPSDLQDAGVVVAARSASLADGPRRRAGTLLLAFRSG